MEILLKGFVFPARFRFSEPMNDEELLRFCARNGDLRVEQEPDGEILVMPPVGSEGGSVELEVGFQLRLWAGKDGPGKTFGAGSGFRLPDGSVKAPDAAWIRRDRWNALTIPEQKRNAPICPDFVIEVRSESDRLPPLQAKMEMWITNGAQLAWLIDPKSGDVTIYRPGESPEVHHDPSSVLGTGPVAGFELILD